MIYMYYMHKDIIYLNLYEVSSLQIQEKSKTSTTVALGDISQRLDTVSSDHLRSIQNINEVLDTPQS